MYNLDGAALYDPEADKAFLEVVRKHLRPHVKLVKLDAHINDHVFAETCVSILIDMLKKNQVFGALDVARQDFHRLKATEIFCVI